MAFFPVYDPVCVLLEIPFSRWSGSDQKDFFNLEKPTPNLDVNKVAKWKDRVCVRKFKTSWYSQFNWLCGSYYLKKLFCLPCLIMSCKSNVWNTCGFDDFGNISRSLNKHEASAEHLRSSLGCKKLKSNSNSSTTRVVIKENSRLYIKQFNENVLLNRRFIQLPIRAVLFLGKQELSFRSHGADESSINSGNFEELLNMLISVSPVDLQEHYKKIAPVFTDTSKTIQDALINSISEYVDDHVKNEIKESNFFSIQVDDATDICNTSKCSVIIRYINNGILKERFLGFYNVSCDRSADNLFNLIISTVEKYDFEEKLIGQCYDGASVMAGHLNDLQAKIKHVAPQAVFVQCFAQHLNLVLEQSCGSISICRIFFATLSRIANFFHHSAKQANVADTILGKQIPDADATRWTSNSEVLSVINTGWESLKDVFDQIINNQSSDHNSIAQSKIFLKEMEDFEFALLAIIFDEIFTHTDVLFDVLQKRPLDIKYCMSQIFNTQKLIKSKRNETTFMKLFESAQLRTIIPVKHREGRNEITLTKSQVFKKYKILYFEILDTIIMQITTRFDDLNKIKFVALMDTSKFSTFTENFPTDALQNLKEYYPKTFCDIQIQRLKSELQLIYANEQYRLNDPHNFIKLIDADKDVFKEAYRLYCLILTIPCTGVSVERSVPCLKRIKTYLRNKEEDERLTNLAKISIEKELLNELLVTEPFYDDIIKKFASMKDRRIDLEFKL